MECVPTVLIVDDQMVVRKFLRRLFWGSGLRVLVAAEGGAGVHHYASQRIDLVITDLMMPGVGGFVAIKRLRRLNPEVRIIAISGSGQDNLDHARELGAQRVFEKPLDGKALVQAVKQLLSGGIAGDGGGSPEQARNGSDEPAPSSAAQPASPRPASESQVSDAASPIQEASSRPGLLSGQLSRREGLLQECPVQRDFGTGPRTL